MQRLVSVLLLGTAILGGLSNTLVLGYDPCANPYPNNIAGKFPPNFLWAAATAAYQVEGAWNVSGKGVNIWDTLCHKQPPQVANGATGDVACDSYHHWQRDIQLLKQMKVNSYRFSISWSRILPSGKINGGINYDGVRYYAAIFQALKANNITPMVTMYHWDLPQPLQDQGGWLNPESSNWFQDYASILYALFGQYVPYWITFNEPFIVSVLGYGNGVFAPQISHCIGTCPYLVTHNIIKSHAKAYHAYAYFRPTMKGKLPHILPEKPRNDRDPFTCVVLQTGDYPAVMKTTVLRRSLEQGLNASRLPTFTPFEIAYIKGTGDFFGLNTYTANVVYDGNHNATNEAPNYYTDNEAGGYQCGNWAPSGSSWLRFTPWAPRGLLRWIKGQYGNIPIIITENGWSDKNGSTSDPWRAHFYQQYINAALQAIAEDKVNLIGYTAWSLMDNFEWRAGYTEKFGLTYVNFSDPTRPRVPKQSSFFYSSIIQQNGFTACQLGQPCQNGATCVNSADGKMKTCRCPSGFGGNFCTIPSCPVTVTNFGSFALSVIYTNGNGQPAKLSNVRQVGPFTAAANTQIILQASSGPSKACQLAGSQCKSGGYQITCSGSQLIGFTCNC